MKYYIRKIEDTGTDRYLGKPTPHIRDIFDCDKHMIYWVSDKEDALFFETSGDANKEIENLGYYYRSRAMQNFKIEEEKQIDFVEMRRNELQNAAHLLHTHCKESLEDGCVNCDLFDVVKKHCFVYTASTVSNLPHAWSLSTEVKVKYSKIFKLF